MNSLITFLNATGQSFFDFSTSMLIQSSVLIIVLLLLNMFLRKKVRMVFLYGIWMLLLVKLVLPTTLSSPIGLDHWIGDKVPSIVTEKVSLISKQIESSLQRTKPVSQTLPYGIKITDLSPVGTSPEFIADVFANFTVAASPAKARLSWKGFAFLGWLAVVIAMVVLLIRRMFIVRGLLAQSKNPNSSMINIFERCRKQMGIKRQISLEISPVAVCPSACGFFRPTILIPQNLPRKLKADDLKSVLLHELAHIKQGDVWVSFIQTILQITYFYNPLLWVANVIIREVREQAVDEMVLVAMGKKAEDYPQTLLNISRMTFGRPALNLRLIGIIESKKALERRIMNMLNRPVPKSSKLGICGLIAIVVIGAVILPMGNNPIERTALAASFMKDRSEGGIIVPGLRVGDYTLGMSKDEVLRKLGEPKAIFYGEERYTLDNLPRSYYMSFGDISFCIHDDAVIEIGVHSPLYKFTSGLGVGDSEQKIKQAFGDNFHFKESRVKDYITYKDKGVRFEIRKKDRTVLEIGVSPIESSKSYKRADIVDRIIVPGLCVGDYTVGMIKDEVLRKLGEPEAICLDDDRDDVVRRGEERYNLNNLPGGYLMIYSDISFWIEADSVDAIMVHNPLYKLSNGLAVGDSEQKIKQAFGKDFKIEEAMGKIFRCYHTRGLAFEIRKNTQTVAQIVVYGPESNSGDSDTRHQQEQSEHARIIRQAVAEGRISYKLTTPDEFKAIVGRPAREWTESDDEVISMEYPGIRVRFFGKPELWPHTLVHISCEEGRIDIGQDRPITLRNEKDLDKFGTFWGYSSVDLSRLDLSKKGELLKKMPFDSRTVWPKSDRLPSDFDPEAVMEWGKYPGLGIKKLHDQDVTGKGVHVAIIDQPLLLGHVEYRDQLVSYKEIETGDADPQMHGPPVASILVGKTCGVAPEAILHYWAEPSWKMDYKYRCMALEQIIQFNKGKEKSEQIRVVSISKGFSRSEPNLDRWKMLLEEAKKSGIYVVHCSSMGFGAGCRFMKDSDNPANYRLCSFYGGDAYRQSGTFFTPIDHRTTASHRSRDAYTFWTRSGLSWGAPYYAGVVALGIQVNPDLRPDQIDKLLYDSGWDFQKGKLINPVGFVKAARAAGADDS